MSDTGQAWADISAQPLATIASLMDAERVARLSGGQSGLWFDFSKTHLTQGTLAGFRALAAAQGLAEKRDVLFGGGIINVTEGRAAEHSAERGEGAADSVQRAKALHSRMRGLVEAIEAGALGDIAHVLHVGIGGSALGPDLLIDALGRDAGRYDTAIVSNVDGSALKEAFARFDPHKTLLVIASKTFTTTETMLNAESALAWMTQAGVDDPSGRVVALTASPEKAFDWGVDETRILPFSESVGGRYSLWSSIGFPAALALGWSAFEELLEGAAEWTGISAWLRWRSTGLSSRPVPTSIMRASAVPIPGPCSPMTSGCGCWLPICSSSKWNRTASA